MKLIFARHGETKSGSEGRFEGILDSPLTAKGIAQAKNFGLYCKNKNISLLYCSPLKRAAVTADIVGEILHIDPVSKSILKEICYGEWEGQKKEILKNKTDWKKREKNLFKFIHPGTCNGIKGESYAELYKRLRSWFEELSSYDQNIAIISHLGIMRAAKVYFETNKAPEHLENFSNNMILIIEKSENKVTIKLETI